MHGVAAKIAQEIGVLFQHRDLDAGAGQKKAEHHPGRPAADDTALLGERCVGHCLPLDLSCSLRFAASRMFFVKSRLH